MQIDDYFDQIRNTIDSYSAIHSSSVTYDRRTSYQGYIKGTLLFLDRSVLHFREFVDVETAVDRYTYAYHYQRDNQLVFRYDNTEHQQKLKLSTFPHHKHEGDEANVVVSPAPTLFDILVEIENHLDIS